MQAQVTDLVSGRAKDQQAAAAMLAEEQRKVVALKKDLDSASHEAQKAQERLRKAYFITC